MTLKIRHDLHSRKTTLLQLIGTLDKIQKGALEINNKDINNLSDQEISKFRNKEI